MIRLIILAMALYASTSFAYGRYQDDDVEADGVESEASQQQDGLPASGAEFCDRLEPDSHLSDRRALGHVREALGIEEGGLGLYAKDSRKYFADQGFIDLLKENRDWRGARAARIPTDEIPMGAIFILDKSRSTYCPVSARTGHVAVKCSEDKLTYFLNPEADKDIRQFLRKYPKCVTAIFVHQDWKDDGDDRRLLAEDGETDDEAPVKAKKRRHRGRHSSGGRRRGSSAYQ